MSSENYRPNRFQLLPEVVKNLLIINGLMFLATYVIRNTYGFDLTEKLGLYFVGSPLFHPYQFISHLFMHGSIGHIFSNMFALWMFGNVLENYWGGKRFLLYYMITGLGAAFIHSLMMYLDLHSLQNAVQAYISAPTLDGFAQLVKHNAIPMEYSDKYRAVLGYWMDHPGNAMVIEKSKELAEMLISFKANSPTVGASGAVFGVLLAYGMLFPNTVIYLYFAIPVKAKYFVIFYGLMELYLGFQNNPADNVAHFAHLGGMLFGFILIKFWDQKNRDYFY